nr:hypothetical protein [Suid alphaherpesvirus 1]
MSGVAGTIACVASARKYASKTSGHASEPQSTSAMARRVAVAAAAARRTKNWSMASQRPCSRRARYISSYLSADCRPRA